MTNVTRTPGAIVWYELFSNDLEASKKFYGAVAGWTYKLQTMSGTPYTSAYLGERQVAGLLPLSMISMAGVPPHWQTYASVPNVDEAVTAVRVSGGKVLRVPAEIPNMGRFAVIQDPQGATLSLWCSSTGDEPRPTQMSQGEFCWSELHTSNPEAAATFYRKIVGWERKPFEGDKNMWVFMSGNRQDASLMKIQAGASPHWLSYLQTDDLEASRHTIVKHGGKIIISQLSVPGVGEVGVAQDNAGAMFGLLEPTKR